MGGPAHQLPGSAPQQTAPHAGLFRPAAGRSGRTRPGAPVRAPSRLESAGPAGGHADNPDSRKKGPRGGVDSSFCRKGAKQVLHAKALTRGGRNRVPSRKHSRPAAAAAATLPREGRPAPPCPHSPGLTGRDGCSRHSRTSPLRRHCPSTGCGGSATLGSAASDQKQALAHLHARPRARTSARGLRAPGPAPAHALSLAPPPRGLDA